MREQKRKQEEGRGKLREGAESVTAEKYVTRLVCTRPVHTQGTAANEKGVIGYFQFLRKYNKSQLCKDTQTTISLIYF